MHQYSGLTLLELLVTLTIMLLLASLSSPALVHIQNTLQLKSAAEAHYFAMQHARQLAISMGQNVYLSFQEGDTWCTGVSDIGKCDCLTSGHCTVNGIEQVMLFSDYPLIALQNVKFGKDSLTMFDGLRGLPIGHAGSLIFVNDTEGLKLVLSNLGRVRICGVERQVGTYLKC
jgi:prepilin peptidase dependent protein A/type IV fimbrial biogenesis protein FimT